MHRAIVPGHFKMNMLLSLMNNRFRLFVAFHGQTPFMAQQSGNHEIADLRPNPLEDFHVFVGTGLVPVHLSVRTATRAVPTLHIHYLRQSLFHPEEEQSRHRFLRSEREERISPPPGSFYSMLTGISFGLTSSVFGRMMFSTPFL